ncbi:MAG: cation transporter [Bacteroidetes bacterium]|nr:MAG: cation transporter [Bacteroidota bacterium]
MENLVYPIEGVSCQHCVNKVVSALLEIEGVQEATVSADHALLQLKGSKLPSSDFINGVLEEYGAYRVRSIPDGQ